MKILLVNDPGIPVPPKLYGGIERIVYQLAEEYTRLGHEVTLLAGPSSYCAGKTICFGSDNLNKSTKESFLEILFVWKFLLLNHNKFDFIHSFGRLVYLLPILNRKVTKVMSYQREVTLKNIQQISKFSHKNLIFTGCSNYISQKSGLKGSWKTVYNFVEPSKYKLVEKVSNDAPLVFLGRLDRIKGCHNCIDLAKATNQKLIIAGNISTIPHEKKYFEDEIKPFIDGDQIVYIGSVNDIQKNKLLGNAKALLMLIDWNEPFGIVMPEAMVCGTPVIGFRKGALVEIVEEGITGFLVDTIKEAILSLAKLPNFNRAACRKRTLERFSLDIVAAEYLEISNN